MLINWKDVNRTKKKGLHLVERLGRQVHVHQHHITNWKANPDGLYSLIEIEPRTGRKQYLLGLFVQPRAKLALGQLQDNCAQKVVLG
jgi:hypothetical protein